ncbi:methionine adenosyltransferase domain-containing protein, partial [Arthrospira platensis SPKY1]|nr:methionine adenosyltransferase domain-containing protein [Arthrospira platensis SPKY1]
VQGNMLSDDAIATTIQSLFDLRPYAIVKHFGLKNPIFKPTAAYGHFGRDPYAAEVEVYFNDGNCREETVGGTTKYFKTVDFFAWEKTDLAADIRKVFEMD